jgi:hypothetical protein
MTQETIELIQDYSNKLGIDDNPCMSGAIYALTNHSILKAANLYTF